MSTLFIVMFVSYQHKTMLLYGISSDWDDVTNEALSFMTSQTKRFQEARNNADG